MELLGWLISFALAVFAVWDGRRQRSKRYKADAITQGLIHRLNGFMIGFKSSVSTDVVATKALNDSLDAIKLAKIELAKI